MERVVYRIAGWDEFFENNRTRELKRLDWVPIPNKMDGDGYTELLSDHDGAAHFGAWIAIVEIASRCTPRGFLLRENTSAQSRTHLRGGAVVANPHDFESLSRISRIRKEVFAVAIPRLISIGWLASEVSVFNTDTKIPQDAAGTSAQSRTHLRESAYGMEGKGMEGKEPPKPPSGGECEGAERNSSPKGETPEGFKAFWSEWPKHPRKIGRSKCQRFWEKHKLEPKAAEIVGAVRRQKSSRQWTKDGGDFIPGPLVWLGKEGWEAPSEADAATASGKDDIASPEYEPNPLTPEQIAAIEASGKEPTW